MKEVCYVCVESAYVCPYCFTLQGYTDAEKDYGVVNCDKCKKEFKVVNRE